MADKSVSFLFSGNHFDRKKFSTDFDRFKEKKETETSPENEKSVKTVTAEPEEGTSVNGKKRKRKDKGSESEEGFSVFKTWEVAASVDVKEKEIREKKEFNRQIERDALLRKKFMFLIISPCCQPGSKEGVQAVILCPTRELATQTNSECKKLAKGKKIYIKLMSKELARNGAFDKIKCDILISTPRRLQLAIRKRKLDLSRVEYLVLDESDKLFEFGFVKQIDYVVKACSNPSIVRSLFSATLPDSVEELARTVMHDAVRVIVGRKNSASELIKQKLVFAGSEQGKLLALRQSFAESLKPPILVFVQSKERAKELYRELAFENIRVDVIHADLSQTQRDDAVDNFRAGKTWVLIATDVIARGMDFKGVNCVINYDFPETASAYIHRIGRSGRAGRAGEAITLYTEDDVKFLRNIANVMAASGCEVPSWIMALPKLKKKKHRPRRDSISTKPKGEEEEDPSPKHTKKKRRPRRDSISTKLKDREEGSMSNPKNKKKRPRGDTTSSNPKDRDSRPMPKKKKQFGKDSPSSKPKDGEFAANPKKKKKQSRRDSTSSKPKDQVEE